MRVYKTTMGFLEDHGIIEKLQQDQKIFIKKSVVTQPESQSKTKNIENQHFGLLEKVTKRINESQCRDRLSGKQKLIRLEDQVEIQNNENIQHSHRSKEDNTAGKVHVEGCTNMLNIFETQTSNIQEKRQRNIAANVCVYSTDNCELKHNRVGKRRSI